jgi:hypothetical protein
MLLLLHLPLLLLCPLLVPLLPICLGGFCHHFLWSCGRQVYGARRSAVASITPTSRAIDTAGREAPDFVVVGLGLD